MDSTKTWKEWVSDFIHGRTHVAYGLIISTIASATGLIVTNTLDIKILFLLSLIGSLGSLVDIASHLYYH
ncbi:hypothetical protein [Mycobacterium sp.]|uniref:hypothetical protein n=1 Tax=Mycobacterium sp. TaxID=1785 RepID=UPI0031E1D357